MTRHGSATTRKGTSHIVNETSQISDASTSNASLKRRARQLVTNSSIPQQTRNLIRYALEIKDPDLAQLVRRVEAGEMTIDHLE